MSPRPYEIDFTTLNFSQPIFTFYNKIDGKSVKFLYKFLKNENERFYDNYSPVNFKAISEEEIESLIFSIVEDISRDSEGNLIKQYFSFESSEVIGFPAVDSGKLQYSQEEKQFFQNLYGEAEPEFQIQLDVNQTNNPNQNSIDSIEISYDLLSSLGEPVSEGFTVSATTGSATGLIIEPKQQVSDVGGLSGAGRDRTIASTGVGPPTTVTTRGY